MIIISYVIMIIIVKGASNVGRRFVEDLDDRGGRKRSKFRRRIILGNVYATQDEGISQQDIGWGAFGRYLAIAVGKAANDWERRRPVGGGRVSGETRKKKVDLDGIGPLDRGSRA